MTIVTTLFATDVDDDGIIIIVIIIVIVIAFKEIDLYYVTSSLFHLNEFIYIIKIGAG